MSEPIVDEDGILVGAQKREEERLRRQQDREKHIERVKSNIAYQLDHKLVTRQEAVELAKKADLPYWIWSQALDRSDAEFRKSFDPIDDSPMTEEELLRGLEGLSPIK